MRHLALFVGGLSAALFTYAVAASAQPAIKCDAAPELIEEGQQFPAIAQHLRKNLPITIVVIGGASTAGTSPGNSYPHFLEAALRRHHPGIAINVINRGVAGQTTAQMEARFAKDVYPNRPILVIWETGTVDAVRGQAVDVFADALSDGVAELKRRNFEVILMDMQYNPATVSVIDFEPYLNALRQTAAFQDVYMFPRYDLMKYWSDAGIFDLIEVPPARSTALAKDIYECLGERLADAIDLGTR